MTKPMKQTRSLGVPLGKGRRFYVVRVRHNEASATVWVSASCVADAFDKAGQPAGAEWAAVYAHTEGGALSRAMGRKVRLKWRPYAGLQVAP